MPRGCAVEAGECWRHAMTDAPQRATSATSRADRASAMPPRPSPAEVLRDIERVIGREARKLRRDLARERIARKAAR
jgi:hypothetical protein